MVAVLRQLVCDLCGDSGGAQRLIGVRTANRLPPQKRPGTYIVHRGCKAKTRGAQVFSLGKRNDRGWETARCRVIAPSPVGVK